MIDELIFALWFLVCVFSFGLAYWLFFECLSNIKRKKVENSAREDLKR